MPVKLALERVKFIGVGFLAENGGAVIGGERLLDNFGVVLEVENEDIGEEFDRVRSKLLDYGGLLRNVLMISDELSQLLQDRHFKQSHEKSATVISDPISTNCTVLSVGERLDLDTVLERVYHPTPSLQELANRVSCRVE
jgi:hypothetical protein